MGEWPKCKLEAGILQQHQKGFKCEDYLRMNLTFKQSKNWLSWELTPTEIRIIMEIGRDGSLLQSNILSQVCCQCTDEDTVKYSTVLPFFDLILEDSKRKYLCCISALSITNLEIPKVKLQGPCGFPTFWRSYLRIESCTLELRGHIHGLSSRMLYGLTAGCFLSTPRGISSIKPRQHSKI